MKKESRLDEFHEKARRLIDRERIEGLAPAEVRWLSGHLASCEQCSARAAETEAALRAIKSFSASLPRGLAASTRLLLREKAVELKQRRARNLALIAGCAVCWVAGVASAPLIWKLCEWFGTRLSLPRFVWVAGFFYWWLAPAAVAALTVLWVRGRAEREEFDPLLGTAPRCDRR